MNKNNSVTIILPDNGMCAIVRKINGRYEIDTGRFEGKDIFLGPQPDPITGLVPCGCGGKPDYAITVKAGRYTKASVICTKCGFESVTYYTRDHAKDAWNTGMGYTAPPRPGAIGPETDEMAPNGDEGAES